jgi:hypothetical protein
MRAFGKKLMDQCNIETIRVGIDLIAPSAEDAAGNHGLGHRRTPAGLLGTMPARPKTQRAGAAPAKCRGC